jgi:thiamine-monophosphate kinase
MQQVTAHGSAPAAHPADRADRSALVARFEYPTARVTLGQGLRNLASACIDVSDGLYVDARRMLTASGCAGQIDAALLPLSQSLRAFAERESWSAEQMLRLALSGGEDYELCFCAPPEREHALHALAATLGERITRIGVVTAGTGVSLKSSNSDAAQALECAVFDHFGR